jgi:hypothetical protein
VNAAELDPDRLRVASGRHRGDGQHQQDQVDLVNVVVLLLGIASTFGSVGETIGVAGLAVALVIIGLFTFLLLFDDIADIRSAITAAFLSVYFSLMGASLEGGNGAAAVRTGAAAPRGSAPFGSTARRYGPVPRPSASRGDPARSPSFIGLSRDDVMSRNGTRSSASSSSSTM